MSLSPSSLWDGLQSLNYADGAGWGAFRWRLEVDAATVDGDEIRDKTGPCAIRSMRGAAGGVGKFPQCHVVGHPGSTIEIEAECVEN